MTTKTADPHAELELDGIWFLTTFLAFGYPIDSPENPLKIGDIDFVQTGDDEGFSQVVVTLECGDKYRIEVEKVPA